MIGTHRPGDIFDRLLAQEPVVEGQLLTDRVEHRPRYAQPTRLRQALKTRRDVYAVTVDVVAIDDDFAQIDTDPESAPCAPSGTPLLRSSRSCCTVTAQARASDTVGKSASTASPAKFTTLPL